MKKLVGIRKLLFIVTLLLICVSLLISGYISGSDFATVMSGSTVAFMGANLGERALRTINKHIENKSKSDK